MRWLLLVSCLLLAACAPSQREPAAVPAPSPETTPEATPAPEPAEPPVERLAEFDPFELARVYEAASPDELVRRLVGAETAIRASDDPAEVAEHARIQQAAYRQLVAEPSWLEPVMEEVPERLRPVVGANVEAGAELRALTSPRDALPDWEIITPPPAAELRSHYEDAQLASGIHWTYLAAIHLVETRMGRIRGTSVAGARGPMQFMPQTWAHWGEGDISDARDSILAAARYLRGHGGPEDMPGALFAYNRSQRYVRAITLYAEQMQAEPRAYLGYYHWQVYYRTTSGDALLQVGWSSPSVR